MCSKKVPISGIHLQIKIFQQVSAEQQKGTSLPDPASPAVLGGVSTDHGPGTSPDHRPSLGLEGKLSPDRRDVGCAKASFLGNRGFFFFKLPSRQKLLAGSAGQG